MSAAPRASNAGETDGDGREDEPVDARQQPYTQQPRRVTTTSTRNNNLDAQQPHTHNNLHKIEFRAHYEQRRVCLFFFFSSSSFFIHDYSNKLRGLQTNASDLAVSQDPTFKYDAQFMGRACRISL